jgi:hypothetical protein
VPKADSAPNVPQARPIENFWALLVRAVYAKDEKQKMMLNFDVESKGS